MRTEVVRGRRMGIQWEIRRIRREKMLTKKAERGDAKDERKDKRIRAMEKM